MQSGPALLHSNHHGQLSHSAQCRDVTIFPTAVMLPVRAETGSCSHATKAAAPTLPKCLLGPVLLHPAIRLTLLLCGGEGRGQLSCVYVLAGVGWGQLSYSNVIWASSPVPLPLLHLTTKASFLNTTRQGVGPALLSLHHLASDKGQGQHSHKVHQ